MKDWQNITKKLAARAAHYFSLSEPIVLLLCFVGLAVAVF